MAYSKFKIHTLKEKLNLSVQKKSWLPKNMIEKAIFTKDTRLLTNLQEVKTMYLGSEKARSELIVMPILQSLYRNNKNLFSIFSGYELNIDKSKGLNGFCDFILSSPTNDFDVEAPALLVVETKKIDINDDAVAQCSAEMYAAQILNQRSGKSKNIIYGCVTSAYSWGFLKLQDNLISIDTNYVGLDFDNPNSVLSTLQWVLEQSLTE